MTSFGTVLKRLDENAKRHEDYYDYAASDENGIALDEFLALPQLAKAARAEKFVDYLFFEGLAWECNHKDKPLDVVYNIGSRTPVRHDFMNTSRAEMWNTCQLLEYEHHRAPSVHLVPR